MFGSIGVLATAIQYALMTLLHLQFDVPVVQASSIGFAVSAVFNYGLNARLTFNEAELRAKTFVRFLATTSAGLALNHALMTALVSSGLHALWAQIVTTTCVMLWNYLVNSIWTFQKKKPRETSPS